VRVAVRVAVVGWKDVLVQIAAADYPNYLFQRYLFLFQNSLLLQPPSPAHSRYERLFPALASAHGAKLLFVGGRGGRGAPQGLRTETWEGGENATKQKV